MSRPEVGSSRIDDARLQQEDAGERHAPQLPAREFVRIAPAPGRLETDRRQHRRHPLAPLGADRRRRGCSGPLPGCGRCSTTDRAPRRHPGGRTGSPRARGAPASGDRPPDRPAVEQDLAGALALQAEDGAAQAWSCRSPIRPPARGSRLPAASRLTSAPPAPAARSCAGSPCCRPAARRCRAASRIGARVHAYCTQRTSAPVPEHGPAAAGRRCRRRGRRRSVARSGSRAAARAATAPSRECR